MVLVALLTASGYSLLNIGDYSHKLWLHRCNSLEKWEEKDDLYDNIEVDVVWRDTFFDVTHDVQVSYNLPLESYFDKLGEDNGKMWIDIKNLNNSNVAAITRRLDSLAASYSVNKNQLIVESPAVEALDYLSDNGYYTSYYVNFPNPYDISDEQCEKCIDSLQIVVDSDCCDAISFPEWWYDEVKEEFADDSVDLLTWCHRTTQFEFFLTPHCHELLDDPQVKVILVKDKGAYHR